MMNDNPTKAEQNVKEVITMSSKMLSIFTLASFFITYATNDWSFNAGEFLINQIMVIFAVAAIFIFRAKKIRRWIKFVLGYIVVVPPTLTSYWLIEMWFVPEEPGSIFWRFIAAHALYLALAFLCGMMRPKPVQQIEVYEQMSLYDDDIADL